MVKLMLRGKSLSAGKSHEIRCEAIGAKPQASISWWVGGKKVNYKIEFRSKTLEARLLINTRKYKSLLGRSELLFH